MFRSWFATPTTIDTKPSTITTESILTIDTKRNQGEKPLYHTPHTSSTTMTMMVSPKVPPSVKSTSVNVNMELVNNDSIISSEFEIEPLRSASISLSIELAKKTSLSSLNSPCSGNNNTIASKPIFMQKPDNITPQSSLPKYIQQQQQQQQQRPLSIASHSSNSLLQRMAHSPKAAPATFSTGVSAIGTNNLYQDDGSNKSAVIESLAKQINPPPAVEDMDELTEQDIHNVTTSITTSTVSMSTATDDEQDDAQDQHPRQQKVDSSQLSTCENSLDLQKPSSAKTTAAVKEKGDDKTVGFWSWLGFPSSENDNITTRGAVATVEKELASKGDSVQQQQQQQQQQQEIQPQDAEETSNLRKESNSENPTIAAADDDDAITPPMGIEKPDHKTKTTSVWSSFWFPSKPSSAQENQQAQQKQTPVILAKTTLETASTKTETATTATTTTVTATATLTATADDSASDANLRKVKSASSLPSSPLSATQTLRYSASISSFHQPPKKKNFVFPPFESQFLENDAVETNTISTSNASTITNSSSNLITKAMDAINSILIPTAPTTPSAEEDSTSSWIAKRMRAKFSNFVEDLKQSTAIKDPVQSAMMDKRIVVVGVHGWFPMKLVSKMIGEPTGTSSKFCEQMAAGIKLYFESEHQVTLPDDAITLVPLQGEGKVEDRVNQLYTKLIDNSKWLEAVSSADVVLWATHSQGTPVSIMLLQRFAYLHQLSWIVKFDITSLTSLSFSRQYFEADAARELFEFMDSNSPISVKFHQSLAYVLKCGTKVVLTGSMQDQVVPLYSAIMSSVTHPSVLRSIYIDGHIYSQDDFLINLIVFALKLRNTGLSDHDLLTHLSEVLAGSLYALEGGHSTIYEELEVYMTAIRYTFETAPFGKYTRRTCSPPAPPSPSSQQQQQPKKSVVEDAILHPFQAKQQQNPFYLPWALHALCTDPLILADDLLKADLSRLLVLFEQWNPTSARLRELKFRLDPLRTIKL
ncbi:hypothetical protein [Parasitella parasitica]|uniref:YMC020W-like alpha/beta hydrolase domain-containing protein n=1 Tax=Parasitella parasitica TaxID=35722 RepID=A0A0B7NKT7_9FUNG|nr:hypothetical protein [Parasitella parasitica]